MKKKVFNGLEWLEFHLLRQFPQICHGIFLRGETFDLGESGKQENQERVLETIGIKKGVKLKQSHQSNLLEIKETHPGWAVYENYDGVMTQQKGVALMIRHADCQAALFYDPKSEVIANIHCGWRGNVKNIYQKTIHKLSDCYGTNPEELIVCISPSLGPAKAEFKDYQKELPRHFWKYQVKPTYFDFWAISYKQLRDAGVLQKNIEIARVCTYSNPNKYFSYRRDSFPYRHGSVVALNLT